MKKKTKLVLVITLTILIFVIAIYFYPKNTNTELFVIYKSIKVNGKDVSVKTGTWGYYTVVGDKFSITVKK
ncbi:MAG: hypothetical protein AB8U93_01755 [Francisella endosymbiont of Hyalomma scupense]